MMNTKENTSQSFEDLQSKVELHKRRLADYLNRKANRLSGICLKACLLIFGAITGFFCILLVFSPFNDAPHIGISIDRISAPKDVHPSENLPDTLKSSKPKHFNR